MKLALQYGKTMLELELEEARLCAVLCPETEAAVPPACEEALVRQAMDNPIGCEPLRKLSRGKQRITIIASDHTRPVPSRILMPLILEELCLGNPQADITILIATGCHRSSTEEELTAKFGPDIVAREHIVVHDCDDMVRPTGLDPARSRNGT